MSTITPHFLQCTQPQFYNYTSLTHYGSYRTVVPFDLPTQITISVYVDGYPSPIFSVAHYTIPASLANQLFFGYATPATWITKILNNYIQLFSLLA